MSDALHVVFVCTGNRARSPLSEAVYRARSDGLPTTVSSYGTMDVGAAPPLPQALVAAARLGLDLSSHRARPLQRGSLAGADLVLGFEPFHLAVAAVDAAAPVANTFLLAELVALLDAPPADAGEAATARVAIADADARRVRSRPAESASITDPLGKPDEVMFAVAERIDDLVRGLVHGLFGRAGPASYPRQF